MELENKLLKDHVTNNQIFIDTILQHNSKLGENFDVSRTIPVTNEARKQENYHMKGNITKKKMLSWIIDKNKKKITQIFKILGDSMVKYIKDKNHNVYVRSFSGAKVKCMKDYVKPSIREKKSGLRYFPWWNKWANSELPPERIVKSIIDVAKTTLSDNRIFSMSGILPRNDSFNIKVMVVNKELSKMCEKEKLIFWVLITSTRKPIWIKANFSS